MYTITDHLFPYTTLFRSSFAWFGCCGLGGSSTAGSRLAGGSTSIAFYLDPRKLELAKEFGATHTVDASSGDPVAAIQSLTGGFGADVCIEAVGNPKVFEQAFYARDLAGTVVQEIGRATCRERGCQYV